MVFVYVFVFDLGLVIFVKVFSNVFVFVFLCVNVIVFFVRSCLLITLIKYLKGHKPLGLIFEGGLFLAVQNSSIGDLVTHSLTH